MSRILNPDIWDANTDGYASHSNPLDILEDMRWGSRTRGGYRGPNQPLRPPSEQLELDTVRENHAALGQFAHMPHTSTLRRPGFDTTLFGKIAADRNRRRGFLPMPGQRDAENMQLIDRYPDSPALAMLRRQYGLE